MYMGLCVCVCVCVCVCAHTYIYMQAYVYTRLSAQSAGFVEYTNCITPER